ncbi:MAG: hypothetical protein JRN39_05940 [Nitrososphaerota archaeon]|nr:hypothetical protein [Nitrososphaerota archaeon]
MPRALAVGHVTVDSIVAHGREYSSIGGPPVYMGIFMARMGFEVDVLTRFGRDFGDGRALWLTAKGLSFVGHPLSDRPSTRFRIEVSRRGRRLSLLSLCSPITGPLPSGRYDVVAIAPVAQEVEAGYVPALASLGGFVYLDPQGFLRRARGERVVLEGNPSLLANLKGVDAVKVDTEEGRALTGEVEPRAVAGALMGHGVREVIVTRGRNRMELHSATSRHALDMPTLDEADAVGAGDMLGAGYATSRVSLGLQESLVRGAASASALIDRPALEKIPGREEVAARAAVLSACLSSQ